MIDITNVDTNDRHKVLECYSLFQDEMEPGYLEDIESFMETVSSNSDPTITPCLVGATIDLRFAGAMLGVYLRNIGVGVILYSAVRSELRGQGIYAELRRQLTDRLNETAWSKSGENAIAYLISEVATNSPFLERYITRWAAHVPTINYRQPAVQGLESKHMTLVFQPILEIGEPTPDQVNQIVEEIYLRVYRIRGILRSA